MDRASTLLSRTVLTTLVAAPLGVMAILSITVLWPALKNPESKIYSSGIGYPALQRIAGKPIKVQTVPVALKILEDGVAAPGESVALEEIEVRPLVSGPVEKVYVVEGQRVRRGQPLLQIQQPPFKNAVNAARNNVAISEANLETLQKSAPKQLARLQANVDSAKERLAIAENKLQEINSLVEEELKNNVVNAEARLAIAETKVQELSSLVNEGAISKFQLYESQDIYMARQRELDSAKKGAIDTQVQLYSNQDFYATLQNQLFSAQQNLVLTESELYRRITDARLKLENYRIALQNALRNFNNTVLYATTDGLVSNVSINDGELGSTGFTPVITLSQDMAFQAYIDQAQLNAVKIGNQATVRLVAYPGRTYQGWIIRLNPTVETAPDKRGKVGINRRYTYSAWIGVVGLQMTPGLQGYVQFSKGKPSLVIPENAVTHLSGGEAMVMVAEAGQAVVKRVKLGRIFDNQREVLEGLRPGEQVVSSPRALNPGDRLEVAEQ